jgi:FKBP-type peptidyl-prolyl cis-trans isomerase FklB
VSRPYSVQRDYYNTLWADRHYNVARSVGLYGGGRGYPKTRFQTWTPAVTPVAPAPVAPAPATGPAATQMEEISYGIGFYLGQEIRRGLAADGVDVDPDDVIGAFTDGLQGADPAVPREQLDAALAAIHEQLQGRALTQLLARDQEFRKLHDENLLRSREFHERFGAEPGVVTLPGGIQYKVLEPGTGGSPGPTDVVLVNIRLSLIDGTEVARWEGTELSIDRMVEAGAQVLPRMKVGAKWLSAIPPDLAYGAAGSPPAIGPNETILAEVELLGIR